MHNTLFNCSYDFFWFSNPNTKHAMIFCQNIFQVSFTLIGAIHILLHFAHSYFVQKEWITYTYLRPCVSLFLIFRFGRWTLLDWFLSVYYFRSLPFIAWEIAPLFVFVFQIFVAQWEWRSNKCAGQGVTRDCAEDGSSWGAESGRGGREWEHPWRGRHHPSTPIPALHGGARSGGCARPRPARLAERCPRISGAGSGVSAAVPAPVIQWYDSTHGHTAAHRTAGTIGDFSQGYVTRTSWNQGWTVWDYFTVNGRVFPTKCWSYPS